LSFHFCASVPQLKSWTVVLSFEISSIVMIFVTQLTNLRKVPLLFQLYSLLQMIISGCANDFLVVELWYQTIFLVEMIRMHTEFCNSMIFALPNLKSYSNPFEKEPMNNAFWRCFSKMKYCSYFDRLLFFVSSLSLKFIPLASINRFFTIKEQNEEN
jgi:hypothetical protein